MKISRLGLMLSLTTLMTTGAFAGPRGGAGAEGFEIGERVFSKLDLTDAQKVKIKEIRAKHKESGKDDRKVLREKREALAALLTGAASNQEVQKAYDDLKKLRENFMSQQFAKMLEVREILTLEQRAKVGEMMKEGKSRLGDRMRARFGGGKSEKESE